MFVFSKEYDTHVNVQTFNYFIEDKDTKRILSWLEGANQDFYWRLYRSDSEKTEDEESFIIDKTENDKFYLLIDSLYHRLINRSPIKNGERKKFVFLDEYHEYDALKFYDAQKNEIRWISDDGGPEGVANELIIKKETESYKLNFLKSNSKLRERGTTICFCRSGSRYGRFFSFFTEAKLELAENLNEYNYCQVTMDEHLNSVGKSPMINKAYCKTK